MSHVKTSKGLLAISSRSAVAASADAPPKGVIVEADSLETNTGDVALLIGGLIQPGDETIKESSSASPRRPGIRGSLSAEGVVAESSGSIGSGEDLPVGESPLPPTPPPTCGKSLGAHGATCTLNEECCLEEGYCCIDFGNAGGLCLEPADWNSHLGCV